MPDGIIVDPRQNPGEEAKLGIVLLVKDDKQGHFFYEKEEDSSNEYRSSRFFPHGFPVETTGESQEAPSRKEVKKYSKIFVSLEVSPVFKIKCSVTEDKLRKDYPMAAFQHNLIIQEAKGLKKVRFTKPYKYKKDGDEIGELEEEA